MTVGSGAAEILRRVLAGAAGLGLTAGLALGVAGCGEEATPIDQTTTTSQLTPHLLEASDQMKELARQQCRDDPQLAMGEVNAVDPERPDQKLATVQVDCAEVRAGRPGDIASPTDTGPTDTGA